MQRVANEEPPKKEKGPVKISIPSLSDFDDVDEGPRETKTKLPPAKKPSGMLALLPPPRGEIINVANSIAQVESTKLRSNTSLMPTQLRNNVKSTSNVSKTSNQQTNKQPNTKTTISSIVDYGSSSDDDEDDDDDGITAISSQHKTIDFFSLSKPINIKISPEDLASQSLLPIEQPNSSGSTSQTAIDHSEKIQESSNSTLTSTVINLPKEAIVLKNNVPVGPKLPVPEQEFHVDTEGNVAFDDKAIEYLCGKRGVKRKEQFVNEADFIDIKGDDIKPDERDWLVKALTEEPVQRPVSIGSGPSSQSKKKHQITYLAHQAKAMEIELKNQWAANKMARQQTRSKYGF